MGTHELPTPTEPAADLVEIVARIVCHARPDVFKTSFCIKRCHTGCVGGPGPDDGWAQEGARDILAALRSAGRLLEPGMVAVPLYRDPSENVEAERLRNVMRKAAAKLHAHNRPALPGQLRMDVRDMLIDGLYATAAATSEEKAR